MDYGMVRLAIVHFWLLKARRTTKNGQNFFCLPTSHLSWLLATNRPFMLISVNTNLFHCTWKTRNSFKTSYQKCCQIRHIDSNVHTTSRGLKLHHSQCSFDITNYGDTEMIYVRLSTYWWFTAVFTYVNTNELVNLQAQSTIHLYRDFFRLSKISYKDRHKHSILDLTNLLMVK